MPLEKSDNIDRDDCDTCRNRRPWGDTLDAAQAALEAGGCGDDSFRIIHGGDRTCDAVAETRENRGLYVVAIDGNGHEDREAAVFATQAGYYVGLQRLLNGTAFA